MTPEQHLDALRVGVACFAAELDAVDLDATVPTCPGWSAAQLAAHVAATHRWVAEVVRSGGPVPWRGELVADDYPEAAACAVDALRATAPDRECWTFGMPPARAGFWRRRQALEVAVHRIDLAAAAGRRVDLDPVLCRDGVDEVLAFVLPRQVALGRCPEVRRPVLLDDGARQWRLGPEGMQTVVTGDPQALLELLWRRTSADDPRLVVSGRAPLDVLLARLTP